jgi:SecD/SecF fusion protein
MVFRWSAKPVDEAGAYFRLVALKSTTRDGQAPLTGEVITDARQDFDQFGGRPEVAMSMNSEGAKTWARMTKENINKSIAIVLDGYVRSYPTVQNEITGGRSSITGLENIEEAKDLANILKSGKMPAPARIMQEEVVGPSLGKEAISSGLYSFLIALSRGSGVYALLLQ